MRNVMSEQARSFSRCTLQGPLGFPVGAVTIIFCLPHPSEDCGGKLVGGARGEDRWEEGKRDQANKAQDPILCQREEGRRGQLKKLPVCLNSLCDEWEEGALRRAFFLYIATLSSSDICAALPFVIHVSRGDDHQPKQSLLVLPGETGAPN